MTLAQLRAFVRVIDSGSIRAAARSLGISQPAVTKAIRALETELDAPLVLRNSRGVEATECGRQLAMRVRVADEQIALACQDIQQIQGGRRARVAVALTPVVFMGVLPEVLRDFRRAMPEAQLKLSEGLLPTVVPSLREGLIDFAVAATLPGALAPDLVLEPICDMPMMVGCRVGHPLAGATRWEELAGCEWIMHLASGSHHQVLMEELVASGRPVPQRIVDVHSFGVSWGLVTRSDALLILPAEFLRIEPYCRQIVRVPVEMALPTLSLGIMRLRAATLSLAAGRLADLFRRRLG